MSQASVGPRRPGDTAFRLRGLAMTRLEAFSDIVFGFALTLLVVSLEVPRSYDELRATLRGFVPFAICFAFLVWVWIEHRRFFRRYGLDDNATLVINVVLLFVVLFFVYPLKFLFTAMTGQASGLTSASDVAVVFTVYGLGFTAVFATLGLLYLHGYRMRDALGLDALELEDTRYQVVDHFAVAAVGLLSCLVANASGPGVRAWAGWTYFLLGPVKTASGIVFGRRRARAQRALAAGRG
jgi:uncharacterized membrane protein